MKSGDTVHLAGYSTIALVLATAEWSHPLALAAVAPLVLWTLSQALDFDNVDISVSRDEPEADPNEGAAGRPVLADGGEQ